MTYSKDNLPTGFYVYAYIRKSNGIPYYIGKGRKNRAWAKHYNIKTPKDQNKIIIIEANLTELGAFAIERRMIKWYRRKGIEENGVLYNKTLGGDGTSGIVMSEKHKERISNANKGKLVSAKTCAKISEARRLRPTIFTEETRAKLSAANKRKVAHNKGKKHRTESIAKMSAAQKGIKKNWSQKSRDKMSLFHTGKKHTKESLLKIKKSSQARVKNPEWREKVRKATIEALEKKYGPNWKKIMSDLSKERNKKNKKSIELNPNLFEIIE